jgi:hypothetical protein
LWKLPNKREDAEWIIALSEKRCAHSTHFPENRFFPVIARLGTERHGNHSKTEGEQTTSNKRK